MIDGLISYTKVGIPCFSTIWGDFRKTPNWTFTQKQISMIRPLANILKQSGCEISTDGEITAIGHRSKKKIVIYPAMWVEPHASNTVFVSDAYIKYAKPYAVQRILDNT